MSGRCPRCRQVKPLFAVPLPSRLATMGLLCLRCQHEVEHNDALRSDGGKDLVDKVTLPKVVEK